MFDFDRLIFVFHSYINFNIILISYDKIKLINFLISTVVHALMIHLLFSLGQNLIFIFPDLKDLF
jgi:hypothetical protein